MTTVEMRLLDDSGPTSWPPECWFATFPEDWPLVAEVWVKYHDPAEHRRILERRESVRCTTWVGGGNDCGRCGVVLPSWRAGPAHQREAHPGKVVTFDFVHHFWTWELLGFPEYYWGTPKGWRCVLDGRNPLRAQWEDDALLLGITVADWLWSGMGQQS